MPEIEKNNDENEKLANLFTKEIFCDSDSEEFFDYCHYRYKPCCDFLGKLRSINLLNESLNKFLNKHLVEKNLKIIKKIQTELGIKKTVWGIKKLGSKIAWEYYFYNYQKKNALIKFENVIKTVSPEILFNGSLNENIPYFMFSIDISKEILESGKIDCAHIYLNPPSNRPAGISYILTENKTEMENIYHFYNPKKELNELYNKIRKSAFVDLEKIELKEILWPELTDCKSICIANKKETDCIYYSGIDYEQFIYFLERLEYPLELVEYIKSNSDRLNHLQYDVGFDYCFEKEGTEKLKIIKSGYYGIF
ncbi:hypothetical protein HOK51_10190 [Candidatus Woesearchaeota archaeon]|jgi:hypothetical protein|nr:hypothetical protein [Candidatus Woesearchaeota archaeon]MBT6520194.1 hypothetical protein [Candidatus Woesearchaeota archaeon]MBT7367180.1 hypothetical protein [Candidatus Woesearchaeota archaeon]